jgi:sugar phosphate isomerase/epimerase
MGRLARLQGCADPELGRPPLRLKKAAESKTYCDEVKGTAQANGVEITELSTHLQGQLVAVHPAYDEGFDAFAPGAVHGKPKDRRAWAEDQVKLAAKASKNLGLTSHVSFSGALAWPFIYSWPPRPPGLIEEAFDELARRWKPLLDVMDENGVDVGYELHPGEDLIDGITFEMFLERLNNHPRCQINYDPSHFVLQQLDYLDFIDIYHERICAFHVKDAEFNPTGRQGVYSGFQPWIKRAGRFRSLGDGQVDFGASSRSLPSMITTAGRCWNGNAASRMPSRVRRRGRPSSKATSSRQQPSPSMISRRATPTRRRPGACWGWLNFKFVIPSEGRDPALGA